MQPFSVEFHYQINSKQKDNETVFENRRISVVRKPFIGFVQGQNVHKTHSQCACVYGL